MSRVAALVMSMFLCGGTSAYAGTIHFTGSDDTKPLVAASGDLSLRTGSFLTSGTGKSTNLVTEFAEVGATTLAGMGTLTVILTQPSTSGWMHINLYTASGGEIQVGGMLPEPFLGAAHGLLGTAGIYLDIPLRGIGQDDNAVRPHLKKAPANSQ